MCGQVLRQAIRALSSDAERARCWLRIKRRDITCAPEQQQMMLMSPLEALRARHRNTFIEGCPPDDPVKLATSVYTRPKVLCDSQLASRRPLISMRKQGAVGHPVWPGRGRVQPNQTSLSGLVFPVSLLTSHSLFSYAVISSHLWRLQVTRDCSTLSQHWPVYEAFYIFKINPWTRGWPEHSRNATSQNLHATSLIIIILERKKN